MPAGPPLSRPARFFCSPAINVRVKRNFSTRKSGAAMPPWGSGLGKEKRGRERARPPSRDGQGSARAHQLQHRIYPHPLPPSETTGGRRSLSECSSTSAPRSSCGGARPSLGPHLRPSDRSSDSPSSVRQSVPPSLRRWTPPARPTPTLTPERTAERKDAVNGRTRRARLSHLRNRAFVRVSE